MAVVESNVRPEKIMHAFKSYASRNLNRLVSGQCEAMEVHRVETKVIDSMKPSRACKEAVTTGSL